MLENLKEYLGRKRTKDVVVATVVLIAMDKIGVSPETMMAVAGLYGVKIGGQSYSDGQAAKAPLVTNKSTSISEPA